MSVTACCQLQEQQGAIEGAIDLVSIENGVLTRSTRLRDQYNNTIALKAWTARGFLRLKLSPTFVDTRARSDDAGRLAAPTESCVRNVHDHAQCAQDVGRSMLGLFDGAIGLSSHHVRPIPISITPKRTGHRRAREQERVAFGAQERGGKEQQAATMSLVGLKLYISNLSTQVGLRAVRLRHERDGPEAEAAAAIAAELSHAFSHTAPLRLIDRPSVIGLRQTTDAALEDHFKQVDGEIVWCQVVKDRNTNDSKGCVSRAGVCRRGITCSIDVG